MPLTESRTIPISVFQRAQFARWESEVAAAQEAIRRAKTVAIETIIASTMDPAEANGSTYEITADGLVITPSAAES